jgi:hypothetical protein
VFGLEHAARPGAHGPQYPSGRGWLHAPDGGGTGDDRQPAAIERRRG